MWLKYLKYGILTLLQPPPRILFNTPTPTGLLKRYSYQRKK